MECHPNMEWKIIKFEVISTWNATKYEFQQAQGVKISRSYFLESFLESYFPQLFLQ